MSVVEQVRREALEERDRMWTEEFSAVRTALASAGVAGPYTFEVIAGYMHDVALAAQSSLAAKVEKWVVLRNKILDQFKVPREANVRSGLYKMAFDDRTDATWRMADGDQSLLYTYEPIELNETYFSEGTEYFVDDLRQFWRAEGLVLAVVNVAIGDPDVFAVLSADKEK